MSRNVYFRCGSARGAIWIGAILHTVSEVRSDRRSCRSNVGLHLRFSSARAATKCVVPSWDTRASTAPRLGFLDPRIWRQETLFCWCSVRGTRDGTARFFVPVSKSRCLLRRCPPHGDRAVQIPAGRWCGLQRRRMVVVVVAQTTANARIGHVTACTVRLAGFQILCVRPVHANVDADIVRNNSCRRYSWFSEVPSKPLVSPETRTRDS